MTLLASERSLLIRNKFRSVLQLRIQNRRQNEMKADSELKSTCPSHKGERDQSETLRLTNDGATQTLPSSGLNTETAKGTDRSVCGAHRWKNTQRFDVHNETAQHRPTSLGQHRKLSLPQENCSVTVPLSADVFEDDVSSCSSSSTEQHRAHQSPACSSSPGFAGDQLLSEPSPVGPPSSHSPCSTQSGLALLSATEGISQPMSISLVDSNSMAMTRRVNGVYLTSQNTPLLPKTARPTSPSCSSCLSPTLNSNRLPRPRKTRDTKPKMRKLKYHQYIPPDQRGGSGTGGGGAKNKCSASGQPFDLAYSRLLKQQQVFLQLQILQSQQQQQQQQQQQHQQQKEQVTVSPRVSNPTAKLSGAVSQNAQSVPATASHTPVDSSPAHKPELLPANLVDLTVSELRQQLRKRGLPVSGTKPALLQRLRPFQLPHSCLTPAPHPSLTASPMPPLNHSPGLSPSSGPDSPGGSLPGGAANGAVVGAHNGPSNGAPHAALCSDPSAFSSVVSVSVPSETCALATAIFLAPGCTPAGSPSPSLPLSSSSSSSSSSPGSAASPLHRGGAGALWCPGQEQQELGVELQMRERIRSRHRRRSSNTFAPFLQPEPVCPSEKPVVDVQNDILFTQIFCCQPCDVTGQDFELPVQITASPAQTSPGVRSLEEELQEAIQKAQMDPSQSIDDILDESIICVDAVAPAALKSPQLSASPPPPPPPPPPLSPHADHSRSCQDHHHHHHPKDDNFLSSPLCSSLLLELPPSPRATAPDAPPAPPPPPPQPPLCTSPPVFFGSSRKRRAPAAFDAGDWLEMLTSGFRPLTPPAAPFVEADFSLDSDLNVNRVLDLMVEQW